MGTKITIKQNDFSHGMQSDTRNQNLVEQTQVFGAEKLKHFDIYKNGKLEPQPNFERFNTDDEINYGITVLGGKEDTTIYGLGQGMDNWYAPQFKNRILLTPSNTSTKSDYLFVDLSQLSDNFWDNVSSDGSDIRLGTNDMARTFLYHFDSVAKTGYALTSIDTIQNTYIYFGASDVNSYSKEYTDFFNDDLRNAITFDGSNEDVINDLNFDSGIYIDGGGRIGEGVTGYTNIRTTNLTSMGNSATVSFSFKQDTLPVSEIELIDSPEGNMSLKLNTDGTLTGRISVPGGSENGTSTSTITAGEWNYVTFTSNQLSGMKVYVNGEIFIDVAYTDTIDTGTDAFDINGDSNTTIEFLTILRGSAKPDTQQVAEGKMFSDGTFWSEGSLETFSSFTPTFSGIGIYQKDINGTSWESVLFENTPIKDISINVYPVPAFIDYDSYYSNGFFFLTSSNNDSTGILYGGRAAFNGTLIDADNIDNILSSRASGRLMNTVTLASDKENYITDSGALDVFAPITKSFKYVDLLGVEQTQTYDLGYTPVVYDSFPMLASATKYGYSLAMAGTRAGRSSIEIWDLINLDPETVIDLGTGNAKVLANVKGNLITVVDNYLQDVGLSRGKPTLDFRAWLGQDNVKTLQSFSFDNVSTVYPNNWEYAIDNRRSDLHNASVFVAEPATDWKGMWAIGSGEKTSQLGVSILYDTESIGRIDTHHSIGNNLIVIKNDGEMYKLNDDGDYTQTSTFNSMVIDAGLPGIEKQLKGIEVVLDKELPVGQVVTVSYSVEGEAYQTVGVCTGKVTEFTLANGIEFDSFKELQIQIETTGGDASIVEYSVKVEYNEELL